MDSEASSSAPKDGENIVSPFALKTHVVLGNSANNELEFLYAPPLSQLPKTLTSLELNYANGLLSLFSLPKGLDVDEPIEAEPLPLSSMIPHLESLKVNNAYASSEAQLMIAPLFKALSALPLRTLHISPFLLSKGDIKLLPSTLTELELRPGRWSSQFNVAASFPDFPCASLTHLAIWNPPTADILPCLPKGLQTLHLRAHWADIDTKLLPQQSLSTLSLIMPHVSFLDSHFDALPAGLNNFTVRGRVNEAALQRLRANRKTCKIENYSSFRILKNLWLGAIDADARKEIASIERQEAEKLKTDFGMIVGKAARDVFWPQNLIEETKRFAARMGLEEEDEKQSNRRADYDNAEQTDSNMIVAAKRVIARLEFEKSAIFYPGPTVPAIRLLPKSLTYLSIQAPNGGLPETLMVTKKLPTPQITAELFQALNASAPTLKHLQVLANFDASLLNHLTSLQLESFSAGLLRNFTSIQFASQAWSRNLKEFSIYSASIILQSVLLTQANVHTWTKQLPENLKILRFCDVEHETPETTVSFPTSFIHHLPEGLEKLVISLKGMPKPREIALLPDSLLALLLAAPTTKESFTKDHLLELPSLLQHASLLAPSGNDIDYEFLRAFSRDRPSLLDLEFDNSPLGNADEPESSYNNRNQAAQRGQNQGRSQRGGHLEEELDADNAILYFVTRDVEEALSQSRKKKAPTPLENNYRDYEEETWSEDELDDDDAQDADSLLPSRARDNESQAQENSSWCSIQ